MIARVEPLTTTRRLNGPFDYRVEDGVDVGSILEIPFGHQTLEGVVVELTERTDVPDAKLVAPKGIRADTLPRDLVELARWLGEEYCSTIARALALVTPPPGKAKTSFWAEPTGDTGRLTDKQAELMARLPGPTGEDLPALRRLEKRGLVAITERSERRAPRTNPTADKQVELTQAQQDALAAIEDAPGHAHLLQGVTGSGKTEVYLRAARAALDRGEGVIVLVPEIALTPQTVARFAARFGDTVALLHSALSDGERYDEWRRLRTGEARIAVGPRSAVFAPLENLGLIVVDEEHDASYKQDGDPRYDARHVAAYRAYQHDARLLLGSATPRPETVHTMARLRLPARVTAPAHRPLVFADEPAAPGVIVGAAPSAPVMQVRSQDGLPPVRILDMRSAQHALHPETRRALTASRKSIVLLNRRGWSNFLSCKACGKVWECPRCDVALVLHRAQHEISCHHCGHKERVPNRCDACGSMNVARHGAGTERVEHELRTSLDVPVFRLDADTAQNKDAVPELLSRFHASPTGLLLGTQMVAKGHDFPDVTLGVVLDADSTLNFPDFRAEERTFALIAQLAGRAGRGPKGGRVLVQTRTPEAPSILAAANHDTDGFLKAELARRKALGYPPFADLIRIITTHHEPGPARAAADRIAEAVEVPDTELLGPAPLFRLRDRERFQIVLKTRARAEAIHAVGEAVESAAREKTFKDVNFSVDVDPV